MTNKALEEVKAALTGEPGLGGEFMPEETVNEIIEQVYESNWLRGTFTTVSMKTESIKLPKITSGIEMHRRLASDGETLVPGQTYGTDEVRIELKTIMAAVAIKNTVVDYGVSSVLPVIKNDIAQTVGYTEEDLVINGDTETGNGFADNINGVYDAVNNPGGVDATHNDALLQFDGLRKINLQAVADGKIENVDAAGGAFTESNIVSMIGKLGRFGKNKSQLVLWVSTTVGNKMLLWESVKTLDKYGPKATVLTGEIGKIFNIPVISTDVIPENLNAVGKYDGVTTDKTVAILANRTAFLVGRPTLRKRNFSIKFEDAPRMDGFYLIPQEDLAFGARNETAVVQCVNIAP